MSKKGVMPAGLKKYWATHRRGGKSKSKGVKSMSSNRRRSFTLPLAVVAGFIPLTLTGIDYFRSGGIEGLKALPSTLIPYDFRTNRITFSNLHLGILPILGGFLVHRIVGGYFGVNRVLSQMRIPILRL